MNPPTMQLADRLFDRLSYRKVYHLAAGALLFFALLVAPPPVVLALCLFYLAAFAIIARRVSFAVLGTTLLLMLARSPFVARAAVLMWVVGDGAAALIGSRWGRTCLPWHRTKTWLGSTAFLVTSTLALALFILAAAPAPTAAGLFVFSLLPSVVSAGVEALPVSVIRDRKPDDNLLIIMLGGLVLQFLVTWQGHALLGTQ